jgi:hypothetical protein
MYPFPSLPLILPAANSPDWMADGPFPLKSPVHCSVKSAQSTSEAELLALVPPVLSLIEKSGKDELEARLSQEGS